MKCLIFCLLMAFMALHADAVNYRIVAMAPLSGSDQIPSETITQWTNILNARAQEITTAWGNGHTLSVTMEDTESSKYRLLEIATAVSADPLALGIIQAGIPNSDIEELARLLKLYGIPSISVSNNDADTLNEAVEYFFSLHAEHENVDRVLGSLMEEYSWKRIALIYDEEFWFATHVADLDSSYVVHHSQFGAQTMPFFQSIFSNSVSVIVVISRDVDKVRSLIREAEVTYSAVLKGFSWIVFGDPEAYNMTQGLIIPQYVPLQPDNIVSFTSFLAGLPGGNTEVMPDSPRVYDAITIFGDAILTAIGQSGTRANVRDVIAATNISNAMSGSISFVTKGFRATSPYRIWNVHRNETNASENVLVPVFDWDGSLEATGEDMVFVGDSTTIPDSEVEIYGVAWMSHRPSYPLTDLQMTELANFISDACNGFTSVSFPVPSIPSGSRLRVSVLSVGAYADSGSALILIPTATLLPTFGISGVLAQMTGDLAELTENIISPYGIPVLSDTATTPSLSNKEKFPTFIRTVAPATVQGLAIISICRHYGWSEVAMLYANTATGTGLSQAVALEAYNAGISISMTISLDLASSSYASQLSAFFEEKPRIVIMILELDMLKVVLNDFVAASYKAEAYIGSDSVSYALMSPTGVSINIDPALLAGWIATRPSGGSGPSYQSFLTSDVPALPASHGIRRTINTFGPSFLANFLDAVLVYADSISRVKAQGGNPRNGTALFSAMRSTDAQFLTGNVKFDQNADRLGSYDIVNLVPGTTVATLAGRVDYSGSVDITNTIVWPSGTTEIPIAVLPPTLKWLEWKSPAGIILSIFAGLGIIVAIIMFAVMVHQRDSPVVMVATWQFLLVMLFGCALGFGSVFTWIGRPYDYTCALRIWIPPMAFILIMAPLLTKTWRLHRIFTLGSLKVRPYPLSYLIAMCAVLFTVQFIICIFWIALGTIKPVIVPDANDKKIAYVVCASNQSNRIASYVTYGYLGLLMLIGCYLTFRVRNLPKDFNESRWIGFSIYNTMLFSIIIIIVGYALNKFPITVMILICVCTLAIAIGAVSFMLAPKLWTLIRHPEKRSNSSGNSGSTNTNTNSYSGSRKVQTGPRHNFSKGTSRDNSKNSSHEL